MPIANKKKAGLSLAGRIRPRAEFADLLRAIATQIAPSGDADFFPSLVRYLTRALGTAHAFVGMTVPGDPPRLRTLALCVDGRVVANREYVLPGTPCERVLSGGRCTYAKNLSRLFPGASDMARLGVESYS